MMIQNIAVFSAFQWDLINWWHQCKTEIEVKFDVTSEKCGVIAIYSDACQKKWRQMRVSGSFSASMPVCFCVG